MKSCDANRMVGGQLHLLSRLLHRRMEAVLTQRGVECTSVPQGWLMHYLYDHRDEAVFQRDVERQFHLRRSSVTGILQNMEKSGLIVRETVESDARLKRIRLTPKAVAQHETIVRAIEQTECDLTAGFSAEELELLHGLLDRIRQNLNDPQEAKEATESLC